MSFSPLAYADSLRIGIIDFVSPDEIKVLLDIDAPDSVALNTGSPRPFPRINSYVLIPSDQGYLVGRVEWITVERSQYPKRKGMQDFGLIDLPYPLRKMCLNPLGSLFYDGKDDNDGDCYVFRRGVEAFPSVGDPVMLPTQHQLRSIVESGGNRRVKIGISPLAGNADVKIDPDRLFGRHLAVLGNTGSGKSCSVAGLIRWSLEEAQKQCENDKKKKPNARFIILDPNGEYAHAFKDFVNTKVFAVEPDSDLSKVKQLKVPLWFWNSFEWGAFAQASGRAQRPLLRRALREMRNGSDLKEEKVFELRRKVSSILISIKSQVRSGYNYEGWKFGPKLSAFSKDFEQYAIKFTEHMPALAGLQDVIEKVIKRYKKAGEHYNDFPAISADYIIEKIHAFLDSIGGVVYQSGPNEDTPMYFDGGLFSDHLEELANQETNPQFFDFLIMRIRTMLSETCMKSISENTDGLTLDSWLNHYIGDNQASNGTVTVIDLSLVPTEVVHIITAVIARITFEALQRYRKLHDQKKTLPTVLVMEEAHTFIKRYKDDAENYDAAAVCCQVFEKIAREGRKYGLGLVLSSQRPSELSPTVLSQCNSFLLHRISNDRDQELVQKLVPDNLHGLLHDLPSLPTRNAILLGWASELPILVQMNNIPEQQRPKSDDPDFWAVWTGKDKDACGNEIACPRAVDWKIITDDWQQVKSNKAPDCSYENESKESESESDE
jgi:hypothetical protein